LFSAQAADLDCERESPVPPKVRELIAELEGAGFVDRGGKGSDRNFVHPKVARPVTISGNPGDDAKHYQVRAIRLAIEESRK
jgi:predicted RNA binding protein YcfA (HicA-like mRNA interferase family)